MEQSLFTALFLPLALGVIMLGMGMTLTVADFGRVLLYPKAAIAGLACQLLMLPILGFAVASLFRMAPELAVGIVLLALCPGGATSNIISHLARADIALSISLTAVSSVATNLTLPIFLNLALFHFMGGAQAIQLPVATTILQIFVVTILPVSIGMLINRRFPIFTRKSLKAVNVLSAVFFVLILLLAIAKERANIMPFFQQAGMAALVLNLSALGLGYLVGKMIALDSRQRLSISIETGIQNGTLAIGIALSPLILNNAEIAIPAVIYSLIMFLTAGAVILVARRGRRGTVDTDASPPPAAARSPIPAKVDHAPR